VQPLAGGWLVDAAGGPTAIEVRRLSLGPAGEIPLTSPGAVVLAVEAGTLTLAVDQALVWRQPPIGPDEWIAPASEATLLAGDGALLQDRPSVTLRNDGSGPLLLLLLTVTANEEPAVPAR
jgi:hypothetical protein